MYVKDDRKRGEEGGEEGEEEGGEVRRRQIDLIINFLYQHPHVVNAAPHTLGVELADGQMAVLISKNSIIPARKTIEFSTVEDNQKAVFLQVYEGEDPVAKNNNLLGKYVPSFFLIFIV